MTKWIISSNLNDTNISMQGILQVIHVVIQIPDGTEHFEKSEKRDSNHTSITKDLDIYNGLVMAQY